MTGAIILAAGAGTRMGGPKATLLCGGAPLVSLQVARFVEVGVQHVVVVAHPQVADRVAQLVTCTVIARATPDPAASLAEGLLVLHPACSTVWVAPVDLVPPGPHTLRALAAALGPEVQAVTPRYHGLGGHPVLLRRALLEAFCAAPPGTTLRALLRATPARLRVDVDDARVLGDLDAPADVGGAPVFA